MWQDCLSIQSNEEPDRTKRRHQGDGTALITSPTPVNNEIDFNVDEQCFTNISQNLTKL